MLKSKIEKKYIKHKQIRICQGDILRNFTFNNFFSKKSPIEIKLPYIIIISQDCDLEQGLNKKINYKDIINIEPGDSLEFNQLLPNILFLPAFNTEEFREGKHFEDLFNIKPDRINSASWTKLTRNNLGRYHYLEQNLDLQIPELVIDFKFYYTLPTNYIKELYSEHYLATINELFREDLSQRFANYLNRIALPEL